MKRVIIFLFLCLPAALPLAAQSNEIIDQILTEQHLSAGSAAYLLLSMEGSNVPASSAEAFSRLQGMYDLGSFAVQNQSDEVSLGLFAYLLQDKLGLPRGIGSAIYPSPRYALRDLKFLKIVQGRGTPAMPVSGERALRIVGRALSETEERL